MLAKFFFLPIAVRRVLRAWGAALGFVSVLMICQIVSVPQSLTRETYVQFATRMGRQPPAGLTFRPDLERQLVAEANRFRASKKAKPLSAADDFLLAARAHAADMALNNFVGHRSSHGEEFGSRMSAMLGGGMLMMPHMAENAARDTQRGEADGSKASRLFQQWVDSPPHRKALTNSGFRYVSTAVVQRDNQIYAVQIFWNQLPAGSKVFGIGGGQPADAGAPIQEPVKAGSGLY